MHDDLRVWVRDAAWRVIPEGVSKRCRRKWCPNPAVAELLRGNGWWAYCCEHLYGRRVESGVVMVSVHPDSPAARALAPVDERR